jgi:hypothetical protein
VCVLETRDPSCMAGSAMPFFILDVRGLQRPTGQVAASKPSSAERRGPELQDTWQHWSPSQWEGGIQSHGTRGSTGALLGREAKSGTAGHVVALEPSSLGR